MLESKPHAARKRMLSHVYSKSYIQNSSDLAKLSQVILSRWAWQLSKLIESNSMRALVKHRDVAIFPLEWNQVLGADFTSAYLFGLGNGSDFLRDSEAATKFLENWKIKMKAMVGEERATREIEAFVMYLVQRTELLTRNPQTMEAEKEVTRPIVYEQLSKELEKNGLKSLEEKELVLASEMLDHFGAGIEAVKITLTYLQWEVSRRPELQTALRYELMSLCPPFKLNISKSLDLSRQPLPDCKALDSLPILDAILKETLRLHPPSPALLTRIVPEGGAVIEGHEIPGGVTVGTSGYVLHMNEDVFPDAQSFKPERWYVDNARKAEMMRWFWVFGSGGRMCIGSHFAIYSELSKLQRNKVVQN
jgi:cytochrome P450